MTTLDWPIELSPIIIISMGNPDRLIRLSTILHPLLESCHILPAIRGNTISLEDLQTKGKYKPVDKWNALSQGQVACFQSHQLAWRYIYEQKLTSALILEDDATTDFESETMLRLMRVIQRLRDASGAWNVLYLGRNNQMVTDKKRFTQDIVAPGRSWGLFAYAVSLSGAERLLKQSRVIHEAVDIFVSTTPCTGRFAITPNIFDVHDDGISDTQQRQVRAPPSSAAARPDAQGITFI